MLWSEGVRGAYIGRETSGTLLVSPLWREREHRQHPILPQKSRNTASKTAQTHPHPPASSTPRTKYERHQGAYLPPGLRIPLYTIISKKSGEDEKRKTTYPHHHNFSPPPKASTIPHPLPRSPALAHPCYTIHLCVAGYPRE